MKNAFKVYKISKRQAKKISSESSREVNRFRKEHCRNKKDLSVLVLKYHLFVENFLYEILYQSLPNPKQILERSSFFDKIILLEALNIMPNREIVVKLKALNRLRNWYVHYLNKDISDQEYKEIVRDLGIKSELTGNAIIASFENTIGYLTAIKMVGKWFPFIGLLQRNNDMLEKDAGFILCWVMINKIIYPEFKEILESLKIKPRISNRGQINVLRDSKFQRHVPNLNL